MLSLLPREMIVADLGCGTGQSIAQLAPNVKQVIGVDNSAAMLKHQELTRSIVGAAIEVHRELGPGLLEGVYEECLAFELAERGLEFERQLVVPLTYKGAALTSNLRIDLLVGRAVVVELKFIEGTLPIHEAQLMTYLRMMRCEVGLIINFNVPVLKQGITRRVL